ncbi:MAG: AMP-binding protein [Christensenellales bacterium]|jgi:acetyl-CoA synthetase
MLSRYLERTSFASYEDFYKNHKIKIPPRFNFGYDIVDGWAELEPDKTAMIWCDDNGEEKTISFLELKRESDRAANMLKACGIGKGDAVMLILKRRYEFWYLMPALHKIGAIAIPASFLLTEKDIEYRNNAASVKAIICVNDATLLNAIDNAVPHSPTLQSRILLGGEREGWLSYKKLMDSASDQWIKPDESQMPANTDIMLLFFTSGTTGWPKMVALDFVYPLGHITTARFWHNLDDTSLHISVADTGWAKCAWGKLYGQWICGAAQFVYDMEKFDPVTLLEKLSKYKVTSFCAPPTVYRFMIREDFSKYNLSALRHCTTAGEPLNPEVFNRFFKLTGLKIYEAFGQSESTPLLGCFNGLTPVPGSAGKPSPDYDIRLLDDNGEEVPIGEEGEICVKTDVKPVGLFSGYYRDAEKTAAVWYDGYYHTGDVAWKDEEGYIWFVGRADDVIKSSGYRIGPFEVESALMEHPSVVECAISAAPDEIRGQIVKATVVLAPGWEAGPELIKELQNHVKKVTAPYKYPRIIDFVCELPKTVSGKIKRAMLRDQPREK